MSLQLHNPHHKSPKQAFLVSNSGNKVGVLANYDHDNDDDDALIISRAIPITLDLFDAKQSPPRLDFLWGKSFLDSKNQKRRLEDHCLETTTMSRRNNNNNNNMPKLDLKLNLSPPRAVVANNPTRVEMELSPRRSTSGSSCVSSDESPEASSSMVVVGCPRCLMYVMLSEDDPKCPKCKSTVLLDFLHHDNHNNNNNNKNCGFGGGSKKTRKS